jgi:adenosine kinase
MNFSSTNQVWQAKEATIGIVCSESADAMMIHALQFVEAGIPFIFDPGQSIQLFDGDELLKFLEQAQWILLNRKEWQIVHQRTGLKAEQVAMRVQALIITQEAHGAMIYTQETRYNIPAARAKAINDPTGCGDAFCAGILYGLAKEVDWETTGRIAALMGAIKVEHHGTQNHNFTLDLFKARFKKNFGYALII